ncbi:unnamed protein product [Effrenium voratum]|nr:unnamed protein product [Effrenium voratum]
MTETTTTVTTTRGECSKGQYDNEEQHRCIPCDVSCSECFGDAKSCIACKAEDVLDVSSCVVECPPGKFANSSKICEFCHTSCLTCAGTDRVCTSCREGDLLDGSVCKSKCPAGKYAKEGRCENCDVNCFTCSEGANSCTSAPTFNPMAFEQYFLDGSVCKLRCPKSKFPDEAIFCSLSDTGEIP